MNKRIVAAGLWFYAGWAFGALVAAAYGLDGIVGPLTGAVATSLFVLDVQRKTWVSRRVTAIEVVPADGHSS